MKLVLQCSSCTQIHGLAEGGVIPEEREVMTAELRDDGLYDVTCPQGHRNLVALMNLKFEVLFQSGAMALLDGYAREAVSSIAAALERFYEFYIRVMLLKHDIQSQELDRTWKMVASKSERQLGAFLFLYLLENNRSANLIANKHINFRNDVIHNGSIPPNEKVIDYGEQVLAFIFSVSKELKDRNCEFMSRMVALHSNEIGKAGNGLLYSRMLCSTIINLSMYVEGLGRTISLDPTVEAKDNFGEITFREALEKLKQELEMRDYKYHNWTR